MVWKVIPDLFLTIWTILFLVMVAVRMSVDMPSEVKIRHITSNPRQVHHQGIIMLADPSACWMVRLSPKSQLLLAFLVRQIFLTAFSELSFLIRYPPPPLLWIMSLPPPPPLAVTTTTWTSTTRHGSHLSFHRIFHFLKRLSQWILISLSSDDHVLSSFSTWQRQYEPESLESWQRARFSCIKILLHHSDFLYFSSPARYWSNTEYWPNYAFFSSSVREHLFSSSHSDNKCVDPDESTSFGSNLFTTVVHHFDWVTSLLLLPRHCGLGLKYELLQ